MSKSVAGFGAAVHRRGAVTHVPRAASGDSAADTKLEGTAALMKVLPCVVVSLCGAFLFGYHLGVVNGALDYIAVDLGITASTTLQGLVVSITLAGATLGSLIGGSVSDAYGRCKSFMIAAAPLIAGALLCAGATTAPILIAARFLCGVGIGLSSCVVPVYISEVAPVAIRGALGSYNQLAICVGILGALIAGLPLAASNPGWWRTMFAMSAVPALSLLFGAMAIPESPRWLAKSGQMDVAVDNGTQLWGACTEAELGGDEEGGGVEAEASWSDLLQPKYFKAASIAFLIFLFQQMAGINAVVYFSSTVFKAAGVTSDVLASAGVGLVNVLATLAAGAMLDKLGRKPLLMGSFAGMAACMLLLAMALSLPMLAPIKGMLCVVGTMAYIMCFGLGVGPVPSLLVSEITSSKMRGKGSSLAMMSHWIFNFIIGQAFLEANRMFGVSTIYCFFAAVCLIAVVYVQTNVVETKGKSLEEIERAYAA